MAINVSCAISMRKKCIFDTNTTGSESFVAPSAFVALEHYVLGGIAAGIPEFFFGYGIRSELLDHEVARIVVCVAVVLSVAEFLHECSGGVAQMQRHR